MPGRRHPLETLKIDAWEGQAGSLSEEEVHREHSAALDATLAARDVVEDELVLELDQGKLRLRPGLD